MKHEQYDFFLKPRFNLDTADTNQQEEISEGELISVDADHRKFNIHKGIARFVNSSVSYADSFGLQWNEFRKEQLDSYSGLPITENRFWENTKWNRSELATKIVLEAGCGAGRFTEILSKTGAHIVSFDLSSAVDANYANNNEKENVFIFQGDIYDIPFPDQYFDNIFCYGVLQHVPDPDLAYTTLFNKLKPGGKISIDFYFKTTKLSPWIQPKYFWRKVTTKMSSARLMKIIKFYIPFWLPVDTLIRKIPFVGDKILACLLIPCWNYTGIGLSYKQRKQWAILDTFDALSAKYDLPKTMEEINQMIDSDHNESVEVFYGGTGVVANVVKK